jgi:hypothetical protein
MIRVLSAFHPWRTGRLPTDSGEILSHHIRISGWQANTIILYAAATQNIQKSCMKTATGG